MDKAMDERTGVSLLVICPTRGRPDKAREAYLAFSTTKSRSETKMLFVVDGDDRAYPEILPVEYNYEEMGQGMAAPVNAVARRLASKYDIVGFIGDDHRFRTGGWDVAIERALRAKPGIAYGNDTIRNDIPTQVFMSSSVILALGWMCLPGAKHLYLDNTWAHLGNGADCLTFLPDIIIEHMHPFFGKGQMDEGYARVNQPTLYQHDAEVFGEWVNSGQADKDIASVKAVL